MNAWRQILLGAVCFSLCLSACSSSPAAPTETYRVDGVNEYPLILPNSSPAP